MHQCLTTTTTKKKRKLNKKDIEGRIFFEAFPLGRTLKKV